LDREQEISYLEKTLFCSCVYQIRNPVQHRVQKLVINNEKNTTLSKLAVKCVFTVVITKKLDHESLVRLFVENGALKSDYGMALHIATVCGNRPIMKYLIKNGSIVSDETLDVARRKNLLDVWDL
jgi:hypothetical protein